MHSTNPLFPTVVLLAAGVLGLSIATIVGISPIVGFFALGAAIGPHALGFIGNNTPTISFLGELGVCFLLFDIGLHLSLKELLKGWKTFIVDGALQFLVTTAALTAVCSLLGLPFVSALVIGAIFSLSSTALVLKLLADHKEDSSPVGQAATEILVFQDVVAILLLVILSGDLSKGITFGTIAMPIVKMLLAACVVVLVGKIALKPLFRLLIKLKSDEVITASALLLVCLTSLGTQSLGLSLALGAFLGGLALSESTYSYLVRGEITPFRSLLLSLFFLSVGINLDLPTMLADVWSLLALFLIFTAVKLCGNVIAFRLAGVEKSSATRLASLLAQGSEFAFVLLAIAGQSGLIEAPIVAMCISLIGISLATTPLISGLGCRLSRSVCTVSSEVDAHDSDTREVIIVGFDVFGQQLAGLLEQEGIPYRGHDTDMDRLTYAKSRGFNVYFSDLNRPRTLARASTGKVLAVISLIEDSEVLKVLITGLKKIDQNLPIIAATESHERFDLLEDLGVENLYMKQDSSISVIVETLMRALGYSEELVSEAVNHALQKLMPEQLYPRSLGENLGAQVQVA